MKHQSKFSEEQQQAQQAGAQNQTQSPAGREFANADEMLRYDAKNITVPPAIAERLKQSTGDLPAPKASWWKRWFGGPES